MKTNCFLIFFFFSFLSICNLNAQRFTHEIGIGNYSYSGNYGNYEQLSIQYSPGIRFYGSNSYLSAVLPMSLNHTISSARNPKNEQIIEIPLALEFGILNPCKNFFKFINSFYIGGGVPLYTHKIAPSTRQNFGLPEQILTYNMLYAGMRLKVLNRQFGLRVNYGSKTDSEFSSNQRVGASISYILR